MEDINPLVSEYFKEGNLLSNLVDNYTYRPNQAELADVIYKTFLDREFLIAEAGTGVGKTYAYLIPAIMWALNESEKVVISTKTKALQEQLIEKDLPNIIKHLNAPVKVAIAKGRENYLCWNKYMKILAGRRAMNPEEAKFVEQILGWAEQTKIGDKKELKIKSELMKHWWIVAADRKSCAKDACHYHDKCFRLKMIRSLDKAGIIVVNHALLLSDIVVDNSILPEYKYLIIDEAHNIDREAFSRLSNRVSFSEFYDMLKSLYNGNFNRGYLSQLKKEYPEKQGLIDECINLVDKALQLLEKFQISLKKSLNNYHNDQIANVLSSSIVDNERFAEVFDKYFELIEVLNRLIYQLESLLISDDLDYIFFLSLLKELADSLFRIMEEDLNSELSLVWVEWVQEDIGFLASSVIKIGSVLHESLYAKLDSLVMLSATITIDDKFDFFISKSGLTELHNEDRVNTFIGESPFCYDKQAQMLVLNDLPLPDSKDFTNEVALHLKEIITITKGRTLVLFTARKQMRACSDMLRTYCLDNNIELLVQNEDGEATQVINSFMQNENSILMGLDSFWEGLDLKGDLLKCLVIVKLPFKAPNDPFSSACDKYCHSQGLNSFSAFSLPDAIMRFKQGIGRLIRSENDNGVVIVLDKRLYTKGYGKSFRESIPIKNVHNINKHSLRAYL